MSNPKKFNFDMYNMYGDNDENDDESYNYSFQDYASDDEDMEENDWTRSRNLTLDQIKLLDLLHTSMDIVYIPGVRPEVHVAENVTDDMLDMFRTDSFGENVVMVGPVGLQLLDKATFNDINIVSDSKSVYCKGSGRNNVWAVAPKIIGSNCVVLIFSRRDCEGETYAILNKLEDGWVCVPLDQDPGMYVQYHNSTYFVQVDVALSSRGVSLPTIRIPLINPTDKVVMSDFDHVSDGIILHIGAKQYWARKNVSFVVYAKDGTGYDDTRDKHRISNSGEGMAQFDSDGQFIKFRPDRKIPDTGRQIGIVRGFVGMDQYWSLMCRVEAKAVNPVFDLSPGGPTVDAAANIRNRNGFVIASDVAKTLRRDRLKIKCITPLRSYVRKNRFNYQRWWKTILKTGCVIDMWSTIPNLLRKGIMFKNVACPLTNNPAVVTAFACLMAKVCKSYPHLDPYIQNVHSVVLSRCNTKCLTDILAQYEKGERFQTDWLRDRLNEDSPTYLLDKIKLEVLRRFSVSSVECREEADKMKRQRIALGMCDVNATIHSHKAIPFSYSTVACMGLNIFNDVRERIKNKKKRKLESLSSTCVITQSVVEQEIDNLQPNTQDKK